MERLANDCFANASEMISAREAIDKITEAGAAVVDAETRRLPDALGHILAADVIAPRNVPPADNSAVDGFAFRHADYEKKPNAPHPILGHSEAGHPWKGSFDGDGVVKILTGAMMPVGFDTVAMIEDVSSDGSHIILPAGMKAGANRRKAGEDIREGQALLKKGTRLRPQELGYLASIGAASVKVYKPLRVALFSTGDELLNPDEPYASGHICDSNRFILGGLLKSFGCAVTDLGILKDRLPVVRAALNDAAGNHDLVITSGGVSMGDEDHVRTALSDVGQLHFWRIAIKPGRPLALGQIGNTAFVGLPGNPIAALVCSLIFVRPLIGILSGENAREPLTFQAKAAFAMKKKAGRTEWLRGHYIGGEGIGTVQKFPTDGSGILTSAVWANGLIEIGDDVTYIDKGDLVKFLPFSELMR